MLPAIIIGLTFHEYAHGMVADRLGDHTARHMGRLTFNPMAHIDPIGFLLLFIAGFGWAKPVPVNPNNLTGDARQGMLLVSLAGPATNMLLAVASAMALGLFGMQIPYGREILGWMISINVILAVFNLIPIPPLDGSKILAGILPGRQEWFYQMEAYGTIILLLLLFSGVLGSVLRLVIRPIVQLLLAFAYNLNGPFI
jgi:Zn-dependent protease